MLGCEHPIPWFPSIAGNGATLVILIPLIRDFGFVDSSCEEKCRAWLFRSLNQDQPYRLSVRVLDDYRHGRSHK